MMTIFWGLVRSVVVIMCPARSGLVAYELFSKWDTFKALGGSRLLGISLLTSSSRKTFAYWLIGPSVTRTVVVATNVLSRTFVNGWVLVLILMRRLQSES